MLELVIWDWSGTVSDDRLPVWATNNKMRTHYGLKEAKFEEWLLGICPSLKSYFKKHSEIKPNKTELNLLFSEYYSYFLGQGIKPKMYDDVPSTLNVLLEENIRSVVVSRHPKKFVEAEAKEYGLSDAFELILGGVDNKTKAMKLVCNKLGVNLENTLSVGDIASDVLEARAANIIATGISGPQGANLPRGYGTYEQIKLTKPDYHFIDLLDLLRVIG